MSVCPVTTPVLEMSERFREAFEARGAATADDLLQDGFEPADIERFGQDAAAAARKGRVRDLSAPAAGSGADDIDQAVAAKIRVARREAGLSQEALAARLGKTFQQIQKYEKGANRVSASALLRIAEATGKPVDWFFDDVGDPDARAETADLARGDPALSRDIARLSPEQRASVRTIVAQLADARRASDVETAPDWTLGDPS